MRKIGLLAGMMLVVMVSAFAAGAGTLTWFSDIETGHGNTATAGSLDLNINGGNVNVKMTVSNIRPESQPKYTYILTNVGSIKGYLDLENIVVTSFENGRLDPEKEAGDTTGGNPGKGKGELQDLVNLRIFIDYGGDGWISTGDKVVYNDYVGNLPNKFELDEPINPGASLHIVFLYDWWSTPNDNQGQTDSFTLDVDFELAQRTAD